MDGERGVLPAFHVLLHHGGDVDLRHTVAVEDEKGLLELRQKRTDRAGRAERFIFDFIVDAQTVLAAVAEAFNQWLGTIPERHDDTRDARLPEVVEHVFEEGTVGDGENRLRQVIGEGAQARSLAARKNDCGEAA